MNMGLKKILKDGKGSTLTLGDKMNMGLKKILKDAVNSRIALVAMAVMATVGAMKSMNQNNNEEKVDLSTQIKNIVGDLKTMSITGDKGTMDIEFDKNGNYIGKVNQGNTNAVVVSTENGSIGRVNTPDGTQFFEMADDGINIGDIGELNVSWPKDAPESWKKEVGLNPSGPGISAALNNPNDLTSGR